VPKRKTNKAKETPTARGELDHISRLAIAGFRKELNEAERAHRVGYMARAMVQTTLPHRSTQGPVYERTNGAYTLTIMTPPKAGGILYGGIVYSILPLDGSLLG